MKRILIFLVVLLPFLAKSQTVITGKYKYTDSLTFAKYKNNSTLDSVLSVDQNGRLRLAPKTGLDTTSLSNRIDARVKYTDTANMLIPYLRKLDTTGKWLSVGYLPYLVKYTDTAAFLSAYYNKTAIDSKLALKLNISDTANMLAPYARTSNLPSLAPYIKYTDTASMLSAYYNKTATDAKLALKLNISDTANMLSSYYNKTAVDSKVNLKVNISDTANMLSPYQKSYSAVKYTDTASMLSPYYRTANATAALALKLNISDTAAMLSPYQKSATAVKYSDTATMLSPYYRTANATAALATKVNISDTSNMLNPYLRSVNYGLLKSGQTVSADSSLLSTKLWRQKGIDSVAALDAQKVKYTDTASMLSPYARTSNLPSLTPYVKYTDTASMLSSYYNKTATDSKLALKVNYTDTASMLSAYYNKTATNALLALKLNISDTANMLSPYARTLALNGYVPYTGGTNNLNLGTHNFYGNNFFDGFTSVAASGTQINLTVNSTPSYLITGSGGQTIKLPDATTLPNGAVYVFNNNQTTGAISVNNNSNTLVKSVPSGAYLSLTLTDNSSAAGSWDAHFEAPSNVSWSTNTLDYPGSITSATWNGNTIAINRGGTGASTASGALSNLGAQPQLNGTGFVKASGTTISYDNSTYLTAADIAGKVNYTDTASMLSAYYNKTAVDAKQALNVKYTDTSSMLSGYYRNSNPSGYITASAITGKVNYTDTSSMLSPYLRSANAAATYLTQSNAASTYYLQTNPAGYITSSAITGKVNYTDTASMLSAYYNKTATDAKLNLKVNISDTASMLSGYKTYYPRAALSFTAGSGAYNNSTGIITIPTNTNQLTNGAGFITGYTETDPVVKAINGIVKSNGTTISAATAGTDYVSPSGLTTALSFYLPLSGGTLTGQLNGTTAYFNTGGGSTTLSLGSITTTGVASTTPTLVLMDSYYGTNALGKNFKLKLFSQSNSSAYDYGVGISNNNFELTAGNGGAFNFYINASVTPTNVMSISGTGKVTASQATFTGSFSADNVGYFANTNTTDGYGMYIRGGATSSQYALRVLNAAATDLFYIKGDGGIGINTTTPSTFSGYTNVSIKGGSTGANFDFLNSSGTRLGYVVTDNSGMYVGSYSAIPLQLRYNDAPKAYVTGSGFGINTDLSVSHAVIGYPLNIRSSSSNNGQTALIIEGYDQKGRWAINGQEGTDVYQFTIYNAPTGANDWTPRLAISNSGDINIGGTVSGGGKLQVNGDVNINGNFKVNGITIGGGGGSGVTGSGTNGYMTKWTGNSTLGNSLIYDNGTSVIVGGTSATNGSHFEVAGSGVWNGGVVTITNTGTSGKSISIFSTNTTFSQGASKLLFYNGTDGRDLMTLDYLGNMGLGINNATARLHVSSGDAALAKFDGSSGNNYIQISDAAGANYVNFGTLSGGNGYVFSGSGKYTSIYSGGVEMIRSTASNTVLINTTTNHASETLQVNGSIYASGSINAAGGITYGGTVTVPYGYSQIFQGSSTPTGDVLLTNAGSKLQFTGDVSHSGLLQINSGNSIRMYDGANSLHADFSMVNATNSITFGNSGIDLSSSIQAPLVVPKMTTAQRDAMYNKVAGAIIYNTSINILQGYNGSTWNNLW